MTDKILYNTKDGKGNNIVKEVNIKKYKIHDISFICPCCGKECEQGVKVKDAVSSKFTDWAYLSEYVCEDCADLFTLYFYSYIVDPKGIRLLNVRELKEQLIKPQEPPFLFAITTTQKKHLFYKSKWNYCSNPFAVNLETETICTTNERMKILFDFVECLQTLGCTKDELKKGEITINCQVASKLNYTVFKYLYDELLKSREIQIPLYCGQKRDISEEEAICFLNSIQMM